LEISVNVPTSLSSIVAELANNSAYAQRQMIGDADSLLPQNVVGNAQIASAKENALDAQTAAANASAFSALEARGIEVTTISFSGILKSRMLAAADADKSGTVSQSEVENLATAGGANKAQADALYAAMDMNSDGSLSTQEFEDSIPVPSIPGGFGLAMINSLHARNAGSGILDACLIMGNLAMQQAGSTPA
jgi:hypothetical protein